MTTKSTRALQALTLQRNAETAPFEAVYNAAFAPAKESYKAGLAVLKAAYDTAVTSAEFAYKEQTAPIYAKYGALIDALE